MGLPRKRNTRGKVVIRYCGRSQCQISASNSWSTILWCCAFISFYHGRDPCRAALAHCLPLARAIGILVCMRKLLSVLQPLSINFPSLLLRLRLSSPNRKLPFLPRRLQEILRQHIQVDCSLLSEGEAPTSHCRLYLGIPMSQVDESLQQIKQAIDDAKFLEEDIRKVEMRLMHKTRSTLSRQ